MSRAGDLSGCLVQLLSLCVSWRGDETAYCAHLHVGVVDVLKWRQSPQNCPAVWLTDLKLD